MTDESSSLLVRIFVWIFVWWFWAALASMVVMSAYLIYEVFGVVASIATVAIAVALVVLAAKLLPVILVTMVGTAVSEGVGLVVADMKRKQFERENPPKVP